VAYIVTDDERRFQAITRPPADGVEPVRLYESYLTNFSFANGEVRHEVHAEGLPGRGGSRCAGQPEEGAQALARRRDKHAFSLTAVTGAGKTVMAAAVFEALFHGDDDYEFDATPVRW
jgi:hypothetical protein